MINENHEMQITYLGYEKPQVNKGNFRVDPFL